MASVRLPCQDIPNPSAVPFLYPNPFPHRVAPRPCRGCRPCRGPCRACLVRPCITHHQHHIPCTRHCRHSHGHGLEMTSIHQLILRWDQVGRKPHPGKHPSATTPERYGCMKLLAMTFMISSCLDPQSINFVALTLWFKPLLCLFNPNS